MDKLRRELFIRNSNIYRFVIIMVHMIRAHLVHDVATIEAQILGIV
jgi:hypothetical protein